jgi:hypothetical protein
MEDTNPPGFLKSTLYAFGVMFACAIGLGSLWS